MLQSSVKCVMTSSQFLSLAVEGNEMGVSIDDSWVSLRQALQLPVLPPPDDLPALS